MSEAETLAHKIADQFPRPHTDQAIYEIVRPIITEHLAESQAREAALREALEKAREFAENCLGYSMSGVLAHREELLREIAALTGPGSGQERKS